MKFLFHALYFCLFLGFYPAFSNVDQNEQPPEISIEHFETKTQVYASDYSKSNHVAVPSHDSFVKTGKKKESSPEAQESSNTTTTLTENLIYREVLAERNLGQHIAEIHTSILKLNQTIKENQTNTEEESLSYQKVSDSIILRMQNMESLLTNLETEIAGLKTPSIVSSQERSDITLVPPYQTNKDRPLPSIYYLSFIAIICLGLIVWLVHLLKKEVPIDTPEIEIRSQTKERIEKFSPIKNI